MQLQKQRKFNSKGYTQTENTEYNQLRSKSMIGKTCIGSIGKGLEEKESSRGMRRVLSNTRGGEPLVIES